MPYVQRDNGLIIGLFANLQPGYAEEFLADDDAEVVAYLTPATTPKSIVTTAAAFGLGVSAGEITGIEAAAGFGAGLYLDVGSYLLFLDAVQADTNYYPKAYDDAASVRVIEKGLDYVLVEAKDNNGNPVDPVTFNVELVRII